MNIQFVRPLSAAQLGIWLGQQLNPTSPAYNAAEFIELRGELDVDCFETALRDHISKNIALNLIYQQTETGAVQSYKSADWSLVLKDYSEFDAPLEQARLWMLSDLATLVDLEQGPIFAQALIKLGKNHYGWYQRIHHIACDGFGFALLAQAVASRYNVLVKTGLAETPALMELNSNTQSTEKNFQAFERVLQEDIQYQQSSAFLKDRTFWLQHLESQKSVPSFSLSAASMANNSLRCSRTIPAAVFAQLEANANLLNVNWADWLVASVAYLLYRRTAATSLTLGLPVMGRMGSASINVPAMVMNIIPLHISCDGLISFEQLVKQVAQLSKSIRPHQRYRYEHLRNDINQRKNSNQNDSNRDQRLFGPVVNIMPFDRQSGFIDCHTRVHNLSAGPVEDISFAFVLTKDAKNNSALRFDLDANPNRYSDKDILELQQELLELVEQLNGNIKLPLELDLRYLSWLEGAGFIPGGLPENTEINSVLASIYNHIQQTPEAIALQQGDKLLTYRQLGNQVAAMADAIRNLHTAPGAVIALALPRGEAAVITALACLLINVTFVFIDPDAPAARNCLILADAKPALLVVENMTHSLNASVIEQLDIRIATPNYLLMAGRQDESLWNSACKARIPEKYASAYLIYTSGSTGTPKGVIIGHKALREFVDSTDTAYCITHRDRVLQFAPLHFDACIEEIFVTLARGARLVIRSQAMLDSIPAFLRQIAEWEINVLDLPTAFWHEMAYACTQGNLTLPVSLRLIIIGGEAVIPERVHQWRAHFSNQVALFNTYGPSETTVIATFTNLCAENAGISIGQPLAGRAAVVVNACQEIVPKGNEGELVLMGGGLGTGYLNLPEKTAESFVALEFPWLSQAERAYRTGDRVKINAANQIEFIGRLDDQIKISGYRIDPLEVEAAIVGLDSIREAAVVVANPRNDTKQLVAHLVTDNKAYSIAQLRDALKRQLPEPMRPSVLVHHAHLPKNSSGKVDRKQLAAWVLETGDAQEYSRNFTQVQQLIADIWQEVLGQTNIQLHDNFFALGGQSLQTIQVATRLSTRLNREIPVALLFQYPTIANLAEKLAGNADNENIRNIQQAMLADCLEFEMVLPDRISSVTSPESETIQCILLTGATGFVGAHLLVQLLEKTQAQILCAVRASNKTEAHQRLRQALAQQSLLTPALITQLESRASVQLLDLELPQLGLDASEFQQLTQHVDMVIHNAAITSVMRDYHSLRAANALSTGELLKLAASRNLPFHLVSTIAVGQLQDADSELAEDFVNIHSGLLDGYQQSKWVAEQMVSIARKKGYNASIYRLARVTGDKHSGYVNAKDLVWTILRAGLRQGMLPDLPINEPWTPVDLIAGFIIKQSLHNSTPGVFNLTPDTSIALLQIYQWLREKPVAFSVVPLPQWCKQIKQKGEDEDQSIVSFFEQRVSSADSKMLENEKTQLAITSIANQQFKQHAQTWNLELPRITQTLFNRYLDYAITHGLVTPIPYSVNNPQESLHHE